MGGLGFLHYNMKLEEQVAQAQRVKRHVPGFVMTPTVLQSSNTIADFEALKVRRCPQQPNDDLQYWRSCSVGDQCIRGT